MTSLTEMRKKAPLDLPNGGKIVKEGRDVTYQAMQLVRVPLRLEDESIEAVQKDQPIIVLLESLTGLKYEAIARRIASLTDREIQVLDEMIGLGKKNSQIAADLGICMSTLNIHRQNIARKLGLKTSNAWGRLYWLYRVANELYPEVLTEYRSRRKQEGVS
jgi:DNA-binding CsgD family transcriptional regulator